MKNWSEKVLYSIVILTESCWLAALMLFLNELITEGRRITIISIWLAYPFAFIFNRFLQRVGFKRPVYFIVNITALILGTLLVLRIQLYAGYGVLDITWLSALNYQMRQLFYEFRPELLIILGNCIFFWRGWSLSKEKATFFLLSRYFQFGFMMLLLVLFISHVVDISLPNIALLIVLFSSLVLFGFGLFRSAKNTNEQDNFINSSSQFLLIVVALIVSLGLIIGSFIAPDLLNLILNILKWVGTKIAALVIFLVNLFPSDMTSNIAPPGETLSPSPREEVIDLWSVFRLSPNVRIIGQRIFVSLFVVGLLIAIYRIFIDIWHWIRRHDTASVTVESISGNLLTDLLNSLLQLLRYLLHILLYPWKILRKSATVEQHHELNSVRQIYRNILRWGASGGYPRHTSETPYEYLVTMKGILPASEHDILSQITDAYILARYGHKLEQFELLQEIKERWKTLGRYKLKRVHQQEQI